MTQRLLATLAMTVLMAPLPAHAAQRTVALTVEKADCALCAPIVKRALARTNGVTAVKVAEASPMAPAVATVTYDDHVTMLAALVAATTQAGYPSHLKK
jgi:mercuric ion binding protein